VIGQESRRGRVYAFPMQRGRGLALSGSEPGGCSVDAFSGHGGRGLAENVAVVGLQT
jgi:hypothetical protein